MSREYMLICRFLVAAFACCTVFLILGSLLYRLEAGFYGPDEMPIPVLDGPHFRARRSFYQSMALVLLVVSILGLATYNILPPAFWSTVGMPALVGAYFSILCAWGFFSDRVRPRLSSCASCGTG